MLRRLAAGLAVRRALARSPVAFCRRLSLQGWERLRDAESETGGVVVLLPPGPFRPVADRTLDLYREPYRRQLPKTPLNEAAGFVASGGTLGLWLDDAPPREAFLSTLASFCIESGAGAIACVAREQPEGRYELAFGAPTRPSAEEDSESLAARIAAELRSTSEASL